MTNVLNTTTDKIVTITMTDANSGNEMAGDFLEAGNELELIDHDDYDFAGTDEEVKWWVEHCEKYEIADKRLDNIMSELELDWASPEMDYHHSYLGNAEFNDRPDAMNFIASQLEGGKAKQVMEEHKCAALAILRSDDANEAHIEEDYENEISTIIFEDGSKIAICSDGEITATGCNGEVIQ